LNGKQKRVNNDFEREEHRGQAQNRHPTRRKRSGGVWVRKFSEEKSEDEQILISRCARRDSRFEISAEKNEKRGKRDGRHCGPDKKLLTLEQTESLRSW